MSETKKILILGVGEAQLNLINEAKNLEYYIIVCDMRSESLGAKLADKFYCVNYMDKDAVLEVARLEQIDGVISNSEPAMLSVAYVAEMLGLPGNSVKSVEKLLSKTEFREVQKCAGVYAPAHYRVSSERELLEKVQDMQYPIIIKPIESSGTRGTTRVDEYDEKLICEAFQICKEFSRNNLVAVEEYVTMHSLTVNDAEIFVNGAEIFWEGLFWQNRSSAAPMVPMTEIFPIGLEADKVEKIKDTVARILREADIKHGEYNVETYFTEKDEVFVIEINPRQGGNNLPLLVKEHSGIDLTRLLVSTSVGDTRYYNDLKEFKRECNYITQQVVFSRNDGLYKGLYIDERVKPFVKWVKEVREIGELIKNGVNAADAVAFVDFEFPTYELQHLYTDNIEKYVYAIVERQEIQKG